MMMNTAKVKSHPNDMDYLFAAGGSLRSQLFHSTTTTTSSTRATSSSSRQQQQRQQQQQQESFPLPLTPLVQYYPSSHSLSETWLLSGGAGMGGRQGSIDSIREEEDSSEQDDSTSSPCW